MRAASYVFVMACVLLVAGCGTVTTKYPIGTTAGLKPDQGLIGTWKGQFLDDAASGAVPEFYLHYLKAKDGPMLAIWVATRINAEGEGGAVLFKVTTGKAGENRFINAVEVKPGAIEKTEQKGFAVMLYRFEDQSTVRVFKLDQDKAMEAIRSGRIAGTIRSQKDEGDMFEHTDAQITAEPAALDAFMATSEGAALFTENMLLKKAD